MGGVQSVFLMKTPTYEARAIHFAPSFCKFLPGDKLGGLSCLLALSPFFVLVSERRKARLRPSALLSALLSLVTPPISLQTGAQLAHASTMLRTRL